MSDKKVAKTASSSIKHVYCGLNASIIMCSYALLHQQLFSSNQMLYITTYCKYA